MKKINFTTVSELEKMNSSEIQNIKGGISSTVNALSSSIMSADSHDHDCKKKDNFEQDRVIL